jgi:uncharacterized protein YyaL (SSP411 family)
MPTAASTHKYTNTLTHETSPYLLQHAALPHDPASADRTIPEIIPFTEPQVALGSKAAAFLCEDHTCKEPVSDIDGLEHLLGQCYPRW